MLTIFWCSDGIVHYEFLPPKATITANYYCLLLERVKKSIEKNFLQLLSDNGKVLFQQDNATPHTAAITKKKIQDLGWECLPHPPFSPDMAPSDYHLFLSLSNSLQGVKFGGDNEALEFTKRFFRDKSANENEFYRRGILKLPEKWKKCVEANGDYFE